jgi:MoaA/NifB/PqqE/SkfB family radical SAM enzyme
VGVRGARALPESRVEFSPDSPGRHLALMVTRRCNMTCGHCSVESGPGVRGEPAESDLLAWVREATAAGVRSIRLTGGEPMLRPAVVLRLVRECRRLGMATSLTTNGFWGRTRPRARRQLRALRRAGLGSLTVSYDRYHADFMGADPVLHIADAADELGIPFNVNLVRGTDEADLAAIVQRLDASAGARLRVYDLQPVGRARELPAAILRSEAEGFCTACAFPAITDDGRLCACNGPSYFERPGSPLVLGRIGEASVAELLERHRRDPILDTIRTLGPGWLRDELRRLPGFAAWSASRRWLGICHLCHEITRDPAAVAALRERLAEPEAAAARLAAWQVIEGSRRRGALSAGHVSGLGACRLFLRAAWEPHAGFGPEAERILGRADLDWRWLADYLGGSGLARPLLSALDLPALTRWAPEFFLEAVRRRAVSDGLAEVVQRETIERVGEALRALGGRGVLLKGTALLLRTPPGYAPRATTDVDVLVAPALAPGLRARLLAGGFEGAPEAAPSTFQHLAPIRFQGIWVEIHTRVMPAFWGLPEAELVASARPLEDAPGFSTLDPEGLLLHAAVHCSAHFFSFGLRAAWDLLTVLRMAPGLDWERLRRWAGALRMPRGFWAPVRVLAEDLGLPVPVAFLRHAPADAGARRAELVARRRLFRSTEGIFDLDALTKTGMMLLLNDGWSGRLRYLQAVVGWRGRRPSTWGDAVARARRASVFRQAWRQYRRYRRAVAGAGLRPAEDGG